MKEHSNRKMVIELDQSVYEDIEEYCMETDIEETELMSDIFHCFVRETMNKMDAMRKGYAEMGHINLEICSEFHGCESEAYTHI